MRLATWLWFSFSLTACGSLGPLKAPSDGGPEWRTVESEHIVLHTDLSENQARETVEQFELRYDLLASLLFDTSDAPLLRTRVVAFRHREELLNFTTKNTGAYIRGPVDDDGLPTIVMAGLPDAFAYGTWQHELTHGFLAVALGPKPTWLNEGMAEYYSVAHVRNNRAVLGSPLPDRGFVLGSEWRFEQKDGGYKSHLPVGQLVPPSKLVELSREEFYVNDSLETEDDDVVRRTKIVHYASSWVLVHMLMNGPKKYTVRFGETLAAVAQGHDFDEAFERHFSDIDPAAFDEAFFDHVRRKETHIWETDYQITGDVSVRVATMQPAHVLRLWARMGGLKRDGQATPEQLLAKAHQLAPDDGAVLRDRADLACQDEKWQACADALAQAREAAPDDANTLTSLIRLYGGTEGPWTAEERSEQLADLAADLGQHASQAPQFNVLAWYLVQTGQAAEAQPHGRRAIELQPGCWACLDTYARIQFELGDVDSAIAHQRQAIAKTNERTSQSAVEQLRARLEAYRQAGSEPDSDDASADETSRD